jgi:hypothetical protein
VVVFPTPPFWFTTARTLPMTEETIDPGGAMQWMEPVQNKDVSVEDFPEISGR